MNVKRVLGTLLSVMGICALLYAAVYFTNTNIQTRTVQTPIVFGVLGLIFFIAGIGLVRTTRDKAETN